MFDTVFFFLAKIGWTLTKPESLLLFGLLWGTLAVFRARIRTARWVLGLTSLASLAIATLPVGDWAIHPIEARFAQRQLPDTVAGIIILGGFEDFDALEKWKEPGLTGAAERVVQGLALARAFPEATIVLSGGSGDPRRPDYAGADIAYEHALALGFDPSRFVIERTSRNTQENAVNTLAMVDIEVPGNWLLVTSGAHMPRSIGIFCRQGVALTPYAVDFVSGSENRWPSWNPLRNMALLSHATREWMGLAVYYATDRTHTFFPSGCPGLDGVS